MNVREFLSAKIKTILSPFMKLPDFIMFCSYMSGGTLEFSVLLFNNTMDRGRWKMLSWLTHKRAIA